MVYTGVYNPFNELLFHLKSLANKNILIDSEGDLNQAKTTENKNDLPLTTSFINYLENKMCTPDLTFDNLLDAVNHIVNSAKKN